MTREPADAATATKDTERRRPGKPCVGGLEGAIPEHDDGTITQQALYPTLSRSMDRVAAARGSFRTLGDFRRTTKNDLNSDTGMTEHGD